MNNENPPSALPNSPAIFLLPNNLPYEPSDKNKAQALAVLAAHLRKYYYRRCYPRRADSAFAEFKQVHNIDIRAKSKENLDKMLSKLKNIQLYYAADVKSDLKSNLGAKHFTTQEALVVEAMLNSDEWVIQHATHDVNKVLEGGNTLLSVGERQRTGKGAANNHSDKSDGNTDNIFCSVGFGMHSAPLFLSDIADKVVVNLCQMQRTNPGAFAQLWTSGHVAAYRAECEFDTTIFGQNTQRTYYSKSKTSFVKNYEYETGVKNTISLGDEIVMGKHIKPFLTYYFIDMLRAIGGAYRRHVLENVADFSVIKRAFHAIFHGGMMEVHAPAKLHLDPKYSSVHPGSMYLKELMNAASGGDVTKLKELIAKGALVNIVDPGVGSEAPHTPLQAACARGQTAAVECLLENGARTGFRRNLPNFDSYTPLMFAAKGGHLACVVQLLAAADKRDVTTASYADDRFIVNTTSSTLKSGHTALGLALDNNHWPVAKLLLDSGASTNDLSSQSLDIKWNEAVILSFASYLKSKERTIPCLEKIIYNAVEHKQFKVLDLLWPSVQTADIEEELLMSFLRGDEENLRYFISKHYDFNRLQVYLTKQRAKDDKYPTLGFFLLPKLSVDALKTLPPSLLEDLSNPKNFGFIISLETLTWWQETLHGSVDLSYVSTAVNGAIAQGAEPYAEYLVSTYPNQIKPTDGLMADAYDGLYDEWREPEAFLFLLKHKIFQVGVTLIRRRNGTEVLLTQDILIDALRRHLSRRKPPHFAFAAAFIDHGHIRPQEMDMVSILCTTKGASWNIIAWLEDKNYYKFTQAELNEIAVCVIDNYQFKYEDNAAKRRVIAFFLARGADINAVNSKGRTMLINCLLSSRFWAYEDCVAYLLQNGAQVDVGFPLVVDKCRYESMQDMMDGLYSGLKSEFLVNTVFKASFTQALAACSIPRLYGVLAATAINPKQEAYFWEQFKTWRPLDAYELQAIRELAVKSHHSHCLNFIAKYEAKIRGTSANFDMRSSHLMFASNIPAKSTSIFVTAAPKHDLYNKDGTGDIDYTKSIVKMCFAKQPTIALLPDAQDEQELFAHIKMGTAKGQTPILHLMLNVPDIGTKITPASLAAFREEGGKVVITMLEFAKHRNRYNGNALQEQALSYLKEACQIIFLDEQDQHAALEFAKNELPASVVIPVPATVPICTTPIMERGRDILSFGMIRDGKGFAHLIQLAELIKASDELSLKDKKVLIVGSVSNNEHDPALFKLMKAIYPAQYNEFVGKTPQQLKAMFLDIRDNRQIQPAIPMELHFDVAPEALEQLFKRCTYSYLPAYRGATLRNSSISSSIANQWVTYLHEGMITPPCLKPGGEHQQAIVLIPYKKEQAFYAYAAKAVLNDIKLREQDLTLNAKTATAAKQLVSSELSPEVIATKHTQIYQGLQLHNEVLSQISL